MATLLVETAVNSSGDGILSFNRALKAAVRDSARLGETATTGLCMQHDDQPAADGAAEDRGGCGDRRAHGRRHHGRGGGESVATNGRGGDGGGDGGDGGFDGISPVDGANGRPGTLARVAGRNGGCVATVCRQVVTPCSAGATLSLTGLNVAAAPRTQAPGPPRGCHRILHDDATGILLSDAGGQGGAEAQVLAVPAGGPDIAATDFTAV